MPASSRNWKVLALLIPLGLALLIQGILIASVHTLEYDEAIFMDVARNIQRLGLPLRSIGETGVFFFDHTPLYVFFLSGLREIFGDNVSLLRLVTVTFALGSVLLTARLVQQRNGLAAGFLSAVLVGVNSFYATYGYFIRMEVPMVFALLAAGSAVARWEDRRRQSDLWLAGVNLALAVLLKEIALLFYAVTLLYVVLRARRARSWIAAGVALSLPTFVGFAAWALFAWTLSPDQSRAVLARWGAALLGAGGDAARMGIGVLPWLRTLGGDVLGWGTMLLLAACGLWAWHTRRCPHPIAGLWGLYLGLGVVASVFMGLKEPRYVIGLIPAAAVLIGLLGDWEGLLAWLRRDVWRVVGALLLGALLLIDISPLRLLPRETVGLSRWLDAGFESRAVQNDRYYGPLQAAGEYLEAHTAPATVIAVVHEAPVVAYYADRPYWLLYTLPLPTVLDLLGRSEYLVVDQVLFIVQTEAETAEVLVTIDAQFDKVETLSNAYRQVAIYRHR
ncbi:MAG: glycosyltransferase family 39 protein [Chloroflexi bacterium]|nr:glycosyltransferase family 39 protein [Chloroflexota bacterium]